MRDRRDVTEPDAGNASDGAEPGPTGGLEAPALILIRATVNLPGLRAGELALVDPTMPYMQEMLRGQFIMPLPARLQPGSEQPQRDVL